MDWDECLTGELLDKWNVLITGLRESIPLRIPRLYRSQAHSVNGTPQLQGFCDASIRAYAAVVYMEFVLENPSFEHNYRQFVAAKTRVSPTATQSIPPLELLSALLLARLITTIQEALQFDLPLKEPICFTDSQVVLHWIKGTDREWKQFVENTVREIRRLVPPPRIGGTVQARTILLTSHHEG